MHIMFHTEGFSTAIVEQNQPAVLRSFTCRRWVEEYHVDGFRFDLASALTRDSRGTPLEAPPLIRDIALDPVLSKVCAMDVLSMFL